MVALEGSLPRADVLLVNGRIYTLDARWPWASEMAISGERILAVGEDVRHTAARGCTLVDLEGRCVLPGLTDCHVHFAAYALGRLELDLRPARSLADLLTRLAEQAAQPPARGYPGEWIIGANWDAEGWPEARFPTAADLDQVAATRPVALTAKNGHALVVNSLALRLAGVGAATPDPPGGRIGRAADGSPDGMLYDAAMELVQPVAPRPAPAELDSALRAAFPEAWRVGLTTIHDMGDAAAFAAYRRLELLGPLGLRVIHYLPLELLDEALAAPLHTGAHENWLRVGGIKLFADGALGSRTAAMLAPYHGEPDNLGLLVMDEEALRATAQRAVAGRFPLAVHAIGDRANRLVLDVLEAVGPVDGEGAAPHRIEHVQLLNPADIGRLAALNVVASMQPLHATQDRPTAERYWGERCASAYAWRSLLEAGTVLAFGSDCPVEDLNPFLGIHAAVTRRGLDGAPGPEGWYPEQRLTVTEALYAYTMGAAYAGGVEDRLGSLAPGKLADLIILDRDVFACAEEELAHTRVLATMIGGQFVYGHP